MRYYSTNNKNYLVSFKDALLSGLAPDKGLYMPERFPVYDQNKLMEKDFRNLATYLAKLFIEEEIPEDEIKNICYDAFNFDVPLKRINDNIFILELFWGPTCAFKDFGARFMALTMSYFLKKINKKIKILVATSGDTGSAVAKGFYKVENIEVVILYPSQKVSLLQEKQLTTLGENITALEVLGTFDDCQAMVKEAFVDKDLNSRLNLCSANSINIGRLIPQSFYYVWGYNRLKYLLNGIEPQLIYCTPSGNFGNLTGGLFAKRMGLNVKKFIAATNENDVVPEFLFTGKFNPRPSVTTYSNAMDVGNPSNFARMIDMYTKDNSSYWENMKKDIMGYKVSDEETLDTVKKVYEKTGYILDPHSAVGYKAIQKFKKDNESNNFNFIFLGTAHPAKFMDILEDKLGIKVDIPSQLQEALLKEKKSIKIKNIYSDLKDFLLQTK
ncbi:MAG TPA: threonine synthase [Spirochaetota bacterium]|nr:threonine synthase [Spirochaetota bacterium]HOL58161.1 threonine synthase [Spirochaetota bacterium]HPP05619.1 threonine synthase [Spirochaetota bacterium]